MKTTKLIECLKEAGTGREKVKLVANLLGDSENVDGSFFEKAEGKLPAATIAKIKAIFEHGSTPLDLRPKAPFPQVQGLGEEDRAAIATSFKDVAHSIEELGKQVQALAERVKELESKQPVNSSVSGAKSQSQQNSTKK